MKRRIYRLTIVERVNVFTSLQLRLRPSCSRLLYRVRLILYKSSGTYSLSRLRRTTNCQFHGNFISFQRNLLRGRRRRNIYFHILFFWSCLTWSNKPTKLRCLKTDYRYDDWHVECFWTRLGYKRFTVQEIVAIVKNFKGCVSQYWW